MLKFTYITSDYRYDPIKVTSAKKLLLTVPEPLMYNK